MDGTQIRIETDSKLKQKKVEVIVGLSSQRLGLCYKRQLKDELEGE